MKKQTLYLLAGICISALALFLLSFKSAPSAASYQHITIIAEHSDLDGVNISVDGKEFSHTRFKPQSQGAWDMNPIINLVHQYEAEGYELQSFSGDGLFHYFWLRKEKK